MKLGVVGNGMIVKRMLTDVQMLSEIQVTSLCVREKSLWKGKELAEKFGIEGLYTDYKDFLQQEDMDTVYIGIVNQEHFSYAKQALEYGKHVICEKPFTVTAEEAKALAELAERKGLFLWEAFKIPYSPIFKSVKEHLSEIGDIKMIQCNYSRTSSRYAQYLAGEILPAFDLKCAGGCLYDINIYNLHFVTALFGKPEQIHYYANKGYNGVDTSGTAVLEYPDFCAVCSGAKDSSSPCFCVIQGTKGFIRVNGAVSSADKAELTINDVTVLLAQDLKNGTLIDEMREFARQFHEEDMDSCRQMLKHSVMMMEVIENAAAQR